MLGRIAVMLAIGGVTGCSLFLDDGNPGDGDGDGDGDCDVTPTPASITAITQVVGGNDHTCAVFDNGAMRCWGEGMHGRTGMGTVDSLGTSADTVPSMLGDVDVGGVVTAASAGIRHTCALLEDQRVRCFGANDVNQLGDAGNQTGARSPACGPVVGLSGPALAIASGTTHNCAVLDDQTLSCWGDNSDGQLGYGHTDPVEKPSDEEALDFGAEIADIGLGDGFSCVLLAGGEVHCWGAEVPWLGNDTGSAEPAPPSLILAGASELAVGYDFACARATGELLCWGANGSGQLGVKDTNDRAVPTVLGAVPGDLLTAGARHSCMRFDDGSIRCWGSNAGGRLGIRSTENVGDDSSDPDLVSLAPTLPSGDSLDSGRAHTCVIDGKTLTCWGENDDGQLGLGHTNRIGDDEVVVEPGQVKIFDNTLQRDAISQ